MAKIYTKTGDDGTTGLLSNHRVFKNDPRIESYGTVDELNATLGMVRAEKTADRVDLMLQQIQNDLFNLGSVLADPNPQGPFQDMIQTTHVERLERFIDELEADLPKLTQFILPGGTKAAAALHLARGVCRRAERLTIGLTLIPGQSAPQAALIYLNRLSDLLFVMARWVNQDANHPDTAWSPTL